MAITAFLWAIFLCFSVGLPITFLLSKKEDKISSLIISPVIGFCTLIAILKFFVGFDLPVKNIAWPISILSILSMTIWIILGYVSHKKQNQDKIIFNTDDKKALIMFLIGAVLVVSVMGIGLYLGNVDAIGMTRIDGAFYSGHADFILNYPVSTNINDAPNLPIMKWIIATGTSYHRIGIAAFQALLLGTINTTANVTTAVVGALSTLLLFCAFMYTGKKMNISKAGTLLASLFGALIPGFQMLAFENFFGAIVSVPILILFLSLFWVTVKNSNIGTAILSGLVLSSIPTIYMQAIFFVIAGIIIIILLEFLMFKNYSIKKIFTWLIPIFIATILNIQYYKTVILKELGTISSGKSPLDCLYPYAVSVLGLERNLFGVLYEDRLLGLLSILFLFCGFFGLLYLFLKEKNTLVISFLAICLSCFVFLSTSQMSTYSFYRSLTMSYPLYAFGFVLFFEHFIKMFNDDNIKGLLSYKWGKRITRGLCYSVILILIANSSNYYLIDSKRYTLSWMQRGLKVKDYYSVNSGVFAGYNETKEEYNKTLKTIRNNSNCNIIVSTDNMTEWAYTILSFTGEKTYFMQDFYGQIFSVDKKYYGEGLGKINVDNSVIIHIPPSLEKSNKILPVKEWDNICVATNVSEIKDEVIYSVFSKKSSSAKLEIVFTVNAEISDLTQSFNVIINNNTYEAIYDEALQGYIIKDVLIEIPKGYTEFNIKTDYIIDNKVIPLSIKSTELTIIKD